MISLKRQLAQTPLTYMLSEHARQRLTERTALNEDRFLELMSAGQALQMNLAVGHFEGCVYELFFSLADKAFFVAVTKPLRASRGGIVVTILTARQHEKDRGPILPALLLQAARNAMSDAEFDGFAEVARGRLQKLADISPQPVGEPPNLSTLPVFTDLTDPSVVVSRANLVRAARVLLDGLEYARQCAVISGQNPDSLKPKHVRVLIHYWDEQHNAKCLRLSNPKLPAQHLVEHGLAAVHRHPAFTTWLADRIVALGVDPSIKVERMEAYLAITRQPSDTIELDLEAPLVDDPAPYPDGDFEDSSPEPALC